MRSSVRHWVIAAAGIAVIVAGAGIAASTGDTTDRPAIADDSPGADPLTEDRARTIAAGRDAVATDRCGAFPRIFENAVVGYRVCLPSGFGLLDLESATPMDRLDRLQAASVRIASPDTFPWEPGATPLDAVEAGATIVEAAAVPAFDANTPTGDCTPETIVGAGRVCERTIDAATGRAAGDGGVVQILAVVPLLQDDLVLRAFLPADGAEQLRPLVLDMLATVAPFAVGGDFR